MTTVYLPRPQRLEQAGAWVVISCRDGSESPLKDEKNATGDVVASGIEFIEEWEKHTVCAKVIIFRARKFMPVPALQCA